MSLRLLCKQNAADLSLPHAPSVHTRDDVLRAAGYSQRPGVTLPFCNAETQKLMRPTTASVHLKRITTTVRIRRFAAVTPAIRSMQFLNARYKVIFVKSSCHHLYTQIYHLRPLCVVLNPHAHSQVFAAPRLSPTYIDIPVPIYVPRYVEVPVPVAKLDCQTTQPPPH